jgi:hypothetical protein
VEKSSFLRLWPVKELNFFEPLQYGIAFVSAKYKASATIAKSRPDLSLGERQSRAQRDQTGFFSDKIMARALFLLPQNYK